jgi:hypothetical protein
MNEFVYRLNLPPLSEILLDSAKNSLFNEKPDEVIGHRYLSTSFIKPEWLTFNNYNWNLILYFYKNNHSGTIHIDGEKIAQPHEQCVWGINWIYGNSGSMEYWLMEDIIPIVNYNYKDRILCKTDKKPYRTYHMPEGAYLVNASFPHNATSEAKRYALSLRDDSCKETWDAVVNKFKDYIV